MYNLHTAAMQVVRDESATGRVLEELRRRILSFELKPGEPLGEDDLARQLEVSRTPVREALSLLQQEGLVRRVRNRGAMVADVSFQSVLEAYEVRECLESAAARRAARAVTGEDVGEIRSAIRGMHAQPADTTEMLENEDLDRVIHGVVLRVGGNRLLQQVVDQTRLRTQRVMFVLPPGRYGTSISEHEAIAAALEAADSDAAEEAMRRHLRSAAERLHPLWGDRQL